jgi:hypothetical protein
MVTALRRPFPQVESSTREAGRQHIGATAMYGPSTSTIRIMAGP